MDGTWTQLWVVAPAGNGYTTPEVMKRIDDHIVNHGACFVSRPIPGGLPIQGDDGSWEVRCFGINTDKMIAQILTRHYGLTILRRVENRGELPDGHPTTAIAREIARLKAEQGGHPNLDPVFSISRANGSFPSDRSLTLPPGTWMLCCGSCDEQVTVKGPPFECPKCGAVLSRHGDFDV